MTWFRLAYRLHRFELRLLLTAAALLVVGSIWVTLRLTNARAAELACIGAANALPTRPDGVCQQFQPVLDSLMTTGTLLAAAAAVAPFMLGLLIGVPLVASEIEARTAGMAWTLSPSRRRWLLDLLIPVLLLVGTASLVIGLAGDTLARSYPAFDGADPGFAGYGMRGPLLAVRDVAVLLISVAVGAVVLPALLIAAVLCAAFFTSITILMDRWMEAEAIPITVGDAQRGASRIFDMAYRDDATGEVISFHDYFGVQDGSVMATDDVPGMTMVAIQVPGLRYPEFLLRESVITGGLALLAGGAALAGVQRRRPY